MCDPISMGIGTFAQGAFGAFSQANSAKARNAARVRNYEYQLQVRKQNWYQSLSVWGAKRNKYFNDITENDLAAQRGYSEAQVGLNTMFEQAAQDNESKLIEYLQKHGRLVAGGRTGRSISRISTMELGALQRSAGRNYHKLTKGREAYKANVEEIRRQQISHRNRLHSNVAFAPVPDLPPAPPVMENQSPGMGLVQAALGGLTSYMGAGGKFGGGMKGIEGLGSKNVTSVYSSGMDYSKFSQGLGLGDINLNAGKSLSQGFNIGSGLDLGSMYGSGLNFKPVMNYGIDFTSANAGQLFIGNK